MDQLHSIVLFMAIYTKFFLNPQEENIQLWIVIDLLFKSALVLAISIELDSNENNQLDDNNGDNINNTGLDDIFNENDDDNPDNNLTNVEAFILKCITQIIFQNFALRTIILLLWYDLSGLVVTLVIFQPLLHIVLVETLRVLGAIVFGIHEEVLIIQRSSSTLTLQSLPVPMPLPLWKAVGLEELCQLGLIQERDKMREECVICFQKYGITQVEEKDEEKVEKKTSNDNNDESRDLRLEKKEEGEVTTQVQQNKNKQEMVLTSCNHFYHKECLQAWCSFKQEKTNKLATCPICRSSLFVVTQSKL